MTHNDGNTVSGKSYIVFRNLLYAIIEILKYGLLNGFPLRGALSYGDIVLHKRKTLKAQRRTKLFLLDDSIYRRAYMEAYFGEGIQEWSGGIVSQSAWNQIYKTWQSVNTPRDEPHCLFNIYPFFTWYPVRMKNGIFKTIAINWNSDYAWDKDKFIDPELVKMGFFDYNKTLPNDSKKMIETLKYLEYTSNLADNVFRKHLSEKEKKERIDIPTVKTRINADNVILTYYSPN